jgi:hypothetical protein
LKKLRYYIVSMALSLVGDNVSIWTSTTQITASVFKGPTTAQCSCKMPALNMDNNVERMRTLL